MRIKKKNCKIVHIYHEAYNVGEVAQQHPFFTFSFDRGE
jgi:hypothetical protein